MFDRGRSDPGCCFVGGAVTTQRACRGSFLKTAAARALIGTARWSPDFGFQSSFGRMRKTPLVSSTSSHPKCAKAGTPADRKQVAEPLTTRRPNASLPGHLGHTKL